MNPTDPAAPNETPLQGWKEIAAYLERDVSTARRWEREADLPVRRHRSDRRSSVFAYPSEVEAWRRQGGGQEEPAAPQAPVWRRPTTWAAVAAVAVAAVGIAYGPFLNPRSPVAEAAEGSPRAEQVWTGRQADSYHRLSADGKVVSFVDWTTGNLAIRDVVSGEERPVTDKKSWDEGDSFAESSALSPDGKRIAYVWFDATPGSESYQLRLAAVLRGAEAHAPSIVFESAGGYVEVIGWLDESRVAFVHSQEDRSIRLMLVDVKSRKVEALKSLDWSYPEGASISPGGRWIAYGLQPFPLAKQRDIFVLATDGSREVRVAQHPADDVPVSWTRDGAHLLFTSKRTGGDSLWSVPFQEDGKAGTPQIVHPISIDQSVGLDPNGDLYYLTRTGTQEVREVEVDFLQGRLLSEPKPIEASVTGQNANPSYSPDGTRLSYVSVRGPGRDRRILVVHNLATGDETEIEPAVAGLRDHSWSPDSASLLFVARDRKGRWGVYSVPASGTEPARLLFESNRPGNVGWMPDGESVHYLDPIGDEGKQAIRNARTGEEQAILPSRGFPWLTLSPDGSRFALMDRRFEPENTTTLATVDARTLERRDLLQLDGPRRADPATAWTPDNKTILFWLRDESANRRSLWAIPADGGEAKPLGLSVDSLAAMGFITVHPDGKRIAFASGDPKLEIWKLSNFLDRLGPTD